MKARTLLAAALFPLLVAACGADTSRTLGFTREAPDEFAVVTRPPLSMPPVLGQLPPPRPGGSDTADPRAAGMLALAPAAALAAPAGGPRTAGEQALLAQAGGSAPENIRTQVDAESARLAATSPTLTDRILFRGAQTQPGIAVDPQREAQRLRENAALGRPVEEGTTPIVQPQRRGAFGGLFDWLF
ncbi:MAG: DUF3035 domain-containing protein [Acetobacteraceae bacterium]